MPWCIRCGTGLSQHELVGTDSYRDLTLTSVYLALPIVDRPGEHFLAWTTTPWTLPSNVALAVHPEVEYARIAVGNEEFILAKQLIPAVFKGLPVDLQKDVREVRVVKGAELVGMQYEPIF